MRTLILLLITCIPCLAQFGVEQPMFSRMQLLSICDGNRFHPEQFTNMVAAYDMYCATNHQDQASPLRVTNWLDLSGTNRNATNGFIPFASNGGPTGTNSYMYGFTKDAGNFLYFGGSGAIWTPPLTVICVVSNGGVPASSRRVILGHNSDVSRRLFLSVFDAGSGPTFEIIDGDNAHQFFGGVCAVGWYYVTFVIDGTSTLIRTNGADYVAGSSLSTANYLDQFVIGSELNTDGVNGLARLWFWRRRLSTNEFQQVEQACRTEYGFP